MRALLVLIGPALLAACATTAPGENIVTTDLPLFVADSLVPVLQQHARADAGPTTWTTVRDAERLTFAASPGGSIDEWRATGSAGGLLSTEVLSRSLPNAVDRFAVQGRRTSLCGLVDVLTESTATQSTDVTPAVGTLHSRYATRTRLTALSSTAPVLCVPQPGTRFTVHVEFESWRHLVNRVHDLRRQSSVTVDMACEVGATGRRASELNAALTGDWLEVDCLHTVAGNAPRRIRWAYLVEARRYLPIEERTEHHLFKIRYKDVALPR
jgi:hypothetical protein